MRKILVLATFLVSLSFGNVIVLKPLTDYFMELIKTDDSMTTLFAVKDCKTAQDKVDGCKILKETKHGGLEQFVAYEKEQIVFFTRIFTTSIPEAFDFENKWVMCSPSPDEEEMFYKEGILKSFECMQMEANLQQGIIPNTLKEFKGDAQSLIKQYVKQ